MSILLSIYVNLCQLLGFYCLILLTLFLLWGANAARILSTHKRIILGIDDN